MIAAVQGGAFAGGAGLMAACDIVIAADDAKIGFPEVRRGLLPALICDVLMHKVREGDLRELFLAGEPIDATRAQQVGLVQRVVPAERLLDEALQRRPVGHGRRSGNDSANQGAAQRNVSASRRFRRSESHRSTSGRPTQ